MMESDAVVVHVQLTSHDSLAYQRSARSAVVSKNYQTVAGFALVFLVLALAFGPDFLLARTNVNRPVAVVLSLFIGALPIFFVQYFASRDCSYRMHEPQGLFLRPHKISVFSNGVSFKSDVADLNYDWRAFLRLEETSTHFFLYSDRAMAYVVPKHHFTSAEEVDRFGAMLHANIKTTEPST